MNMNMNDNHLGFAIHFVGYSRGVSTALKDRFASVTEVRVSDGDGVENLYPTKASQVGIAFVSPANSLLFMDGGIDRIYSEVMFKGVQRTLKRRLTESHPTLYTTLGRPYLPIACALLVPTCKDSESFLISAPTMCLPQDVSTTRNAYHAFMATLCIFQGAKKTSCPNIHTIVCPGLCTGWGCMPADVAADQMFEAYSDFMTGSLPSNSRFETYPSHCFFCAEEPRSEQPNYYMNTEFKSINVADIVLSNQ